MDFLFSHDGQTFAKHSECAEGRTTQVLFDQVKPAMRTQRENFERSYASAWNSGSYNAWSDLRDAIASFRR
jgi:hypothetical protein